MFRLFCLLVAFSACLSCKSTKKANTTSANDVTEKVDKVRNNGKLVIVIDDAQNNSVLEADFSKYKLKLKKPMSRKEAKGLYYYNADKIGKKKLINKLLKKEYVISAEGLNHGIHQVPTATSSGTVKESKPVR